MFEKHKNSLAPRSIFLRRLAISLALGICGIALTLFIGMLGYHIFEKMSWIDAFANASMILSGMGPFGPLQTSAGKIFAGIYALFSGLAFISITAIIFAPVIHRFLHKFHLPDK
jgi:hypothetical protein